MTQSAPTTRLKMSIVAVLYFAQGAPYACINISMPVFFREMGMSLDKIGILGLMGLPWMLKPLWAPFVDKFGKRWQWISAMQVSIALLAIALSSYYVNPSIGFLLWIAVLTICVASATQDISIDAYTIEMLEEKELGQANGIRSAAFRVAVIAAGGGFLALSQYLGWRNVFWGFSAFLLFFAVLVGAIGTSYSFTTAERKETLLGAYWEPLRRLFKIRNFLIAALFILMFKVGDAMMVYMVGPFWIDHGFTKAEFGTISATFGVVLTILGSLVGGWITGRIGIFRGLMFLGAFQAISNLGYAYAALHTTKMTVYGASMFESFTSGLGTAPFLAALMSLCEKEFAAMQYASLSAVFSFSRQISGYVGGVAAKNFGYFNFFVLSFFVALIAFPLLFFLKNTFQPKKQ